MTSGHNPSQVLNGMTLLRQALAERFPRDREALVIHGVEVPIPCVLGRLDEYIALYLDAEHAHRQLAKAVKDRGDAEPEALRFLADLRDAMVPHFGRHSAELAGFGIRPKKIRGR